jgi:hypothetical protein
MQMMVTTLGVMETLEQEGWSSRPETVFYPPDKLCAHHI